MPTTRPRYQVTDTGRVRVLLDTAAEAWPQLAGDRKALLLKLAEEGAQHLPPPAGSLEDELRAYAGRWVAVRGGRLLAGRESAQELVEWLRAHDERAEQLFRVPAHPDGELPAEHGLA